ncbi:MAG: hypothetical protein JKX85_06220 [Phycisphaeraceae bacterium]|nr:hypothetical protein [Phycisphaeraceae bacterium]
MDDTRYTNHHTAGDEASRVLAQIQAQVRDAMESGNLPPKMLYAQPGVSRSTVARMLSNETPSSGDQQFSTIFHIIDRLPEDLRLPVIQTLVRNWDVKVIPVQDIDLDLNGDNIVDATDERMATMHLNETVTRMVSHIINAVEDGKVDENEQAVAQRLRSEINASVSQVVEIAVTMAKQSTQRRKARMPQGPRLARAGF